MSVDFATRAPGLLLGLLQPHAVLGRAGLCAFRGRIWSSLGYKNSPRLFASELFLFGLFLFGLFALEIFLFGLFIFGLFALGLLVFAALASQA